MTAMKHNSMPDASGRMERAGQKDAVLAFSNDDRSLASDHGPVTTGFTYSYSLFSQLIIVKNGQGCPVRKVLDD